MKTKLLFLLAASFALACTPSEKKNENVPAEQHGAEGQHHEEAASGLMLNNGVKWKADESTSRHVQMLRETLGGFSAGDSKLLEDYLNTGAALQKTIESLVQGCSMQGPDHDALHLWLEPLMQKVDKLKTAADLSQAVSSYEEVNSQVNLFEKFFE
jgi:phage shock protein A